MGMANVGIYMAMTVFICSMLDKKMLISDYNLSFPVFHVNPLQLFFEYSVFHLLCPIICQCCWMADTLVFTVRYSNEKSCSVQADLNRWRTNRLTSKNLSDYDVIKVIDSSSHSFYFGLNSSSLHSRKSDEILINGLYATKVGLKNNDIVSVNLLKTVPICLKAWIEPVTVDDWEILEIHAEKVEGSLLDQIRVLWPGQVFPLWVTSGVCIFLRTVGIDPPSQCAILMPLTELIVEPKVDTGAIRESENLSHKLDTRAASGDVISTRNGIDEIKHEDTGITSSPEEVSDSGSEAGDDIVVATPLLRRLLKVWIIRRFMSVIKYIWNLVAERIVPAIIGKFSFLRITAPNERSHNLCNSSLNETVLSKIYDFPSKFNLVLRIEDTQPHTSSNLLFESFDQAGYALLDYSNNDNISVQDYQIFLVEIHKLPQKNSKGQQQPESDSSPNIDVSSGAVVRLCIRSMSKFAMFLKNDNGRNNALKVVAKSLKLSPVLRMQHKIGITSKVQLKKLLKVPKAVAKNVKTIIIQSLAQVPSDISEFDFKKSFEDWIPLVTDAENPMPITCGTIFLLPVRKFMENDKENSISNIHVRIEKLIDSGGIASFEYYLFSRKDLSSVSIEFVLEPVTDSVILDEIDPKIPSESIAGLIPCQTAVISECLRHCESVFKSRPIPHKLCSDICHPGFIMVTGPSGIGKSYLSRVLLRKLATSSEDPVYVRMISCSSLKGKKPETIKKMLTGIVWELEWRQPSALLLEDFNHLVSASKSPDGENSASATYVLQLAVLFKDIFSQLSKETDGQPKKILIVATAISEQSVHPLLLPARGCYIFSKIVELTLPDKSQRSQYVKAIMLKQLSISNRSLSRINFEEIASLTEGYAPKDYELLMKRALIYRLQKGKTVSVKTADVIKAITGFIPISLQDAKLNKPKKYSWDDVGGLENVRKQLTEQLVWPIKYSQLYRSAGMQLRSGILLYGPPGCGKTLLAGVVANECNLNFISVKGPELLSKYIGASEAAVRQLFHRAVAAAPCLLFFDEFDSIAQKRGHDNTGVTDRVVNQFLTHLDGVEPLSGVYVLAATSRPDLIDPAILRPGRLDTHLHCPMPDFDERCLILQCLMKKISLADEINIRAIAAKCEHFTGADLRALVYDAQLSALHGDVDSKSHLNVSDSSSNVTVPSSLEMELDDQYSSNGFQGALDDVIDESTESSVGDVTLTVQDFTKTAAKLAKSIQEQNQKNPRPYGSGQYQICYTMPPSGNPSDSKPGITPATESNVIYFPSLYSKTDISSPLPESIQTIVDNITNSESSACLPHQASPESKLILVASHHFDAVLESAAPSVSTAERRLYMAICDNFGKKGNYDENQNMDLRRQKRTTLA